VWRTYKSAERLVTLLECWLRQRLAVFLSWKKVVELLQLVHYLDANPGLVLQHGELPGGICRRDGLAV
jgi:hypothetical protein